MARLAPLEHPLAPEVADQLARMMPPGEAPIALFRLFAKNLPMTEAMLPWGSYELGRQLTLSRRRAGDRHPSHLRSLRLRVRVGCPRRSLRRARGPRRRAGHVAHLGRAERRLLVQRAGPPAHRGVDALHATSDLPDVLWRRLVGRSSTNRRCSTCCCSPGGTTRSASRPALRGCPSKPGRHASRTSNQSGVTNRSGASCQRVRPSVTAASRCRRPKL